MSMIKSEWERYRKLKAEAWAKEYGCEDRLQRARDVVEVMQQNGVNISALDPSGTASPAHVAASIPDVALLIALDEAGANLDVMDNNGATPAHVLCLRMVTEPEAEKAATFLSNRHVRFNRRRKPEDATSSPYNVLEQWPTWREHWVGWVKKNRDKDGKTVVPWLFLVGAFLKHRRRVSKVKRFVRSLG